MILGIIIYVGTISFDIYEYPLVIERRNFVTLVHDNDRMAVHFSSVFPCFWWLMLTLVALTTGRTEYSFERPK